MYRLGKKSDDNSRIRPVLVKFSNPSIKTNLVRNAFKLKDSIYSISIDKTKEGPNAFKMLLKEKKELEQNDQKIFRGMDVHNQRPTLGSENPKTQSKTTLNNSRANSCNLCYVYKC